MALDPESLPAALAEIRAGRAKCSTCPVTLPMCAGQHNRAMCNVENRVAYEDDGVTVVVSAPPWSFFDLRKRISNYLSFGPPGEPTGNSLDVPADDPSRGNSGTGPFEVIDEF